MTKAQCLCLLSVAFEILALFLYFNLINLLIIYCEIFYSVNTVNVIIKSYMLKSCFYFFKLCCLLQRLSVCLLNLSVVSGSLQPHGLLPARLFCPWDSLGKNTRVGSHSLLQGIFLTQGLNLDLLNCKQILYHLSYQGRPKESCTILKNKTKLQSIKKEKQELSQNCTT